MRIVRALPVHREERGGARDGEDERPPCRGVPVPTAHVEREREPRCRDRERGERMGPAQISAVGRLERRRVEHRHERRLAVGGVGVERAAVVDRDGLGGNRRLVGVEELVRETRQPHHCGEQQRGDGERAERARDPLARHDVETTCTAVGFCVVYDAPIPFAHRGGIDGGHPENSLAAFADALRRDAALETDVRLSSDGVPVLVHDADFARSGVPFPVRATRAATLARHGIPSLADLYQALGTRFELSIDVKARRGRPTRNRCGARTPDARRRLWLVHSDLATLGDLRGYDTEVRLVHEARPPEGGDLTTVADARAPRRSRRVASTRRTGIGDRGRRRRWMRCTRTTYWRSDRSSTRLTSSPTRRHVVWTRVQRSCPRTRGRVERERGVSPAVQAVLFDFGSTLFGHEPGPAVVRHEAAALGVTLSMAEAASIWVDIDAAVSTPAELAAGRDLDAAVWRSRWPLIYAARDVQVAGLGAALDRAFHDPAEWIPYADSASALVRARAGGLRVGVASNTGWDIRAVFVAHEMLDLVDTFTLSYECGAVKPQPEFFAAASAAVTWSRRPRSDVGGATPPPTA